MANSHVIDYQIKGESIQIVEVELDPMETVIAEAGAMLFMEDGIQFETKMGMDPILIKECSINCFRLEADC
jgi:uncharacterized protein (AIM24 family)